MSAPKGNQNAAKKDSRKGVLLHFRVTEEQATSYRVKAGHLRLSDWIRDTLDRASSNWDT